MDDLKVALAGEKSKPSPIFNEVYPVTKYVASDIGGEEKYQRGYPHKIYHFDIDESGNFKTIHVKFASEFVRESLGETRLKQLHNRYKKFTFGTDSNNKTPSEKGFVYEDFVIGAFIYAIPGSQIHESLKVEEKDEKGRYKMGRVFGISGTVYDGTPHKSSGMIKAIKAISKKEFYSNKSTIILPVQGFKCLDFVVVDRSETKTKVSLFQITIDKSKKISPFDVNEYSTLLDQPLDVSFYLITQNPELKKISWEGLKKKDKKDDKPDKKDKKDKKDNKKDENEETDENKDEKKLVEEKDIDKFTGEQCQTEIANITTKWERKMNLIFFDPIRNLDTLVTI